MPPNWNVIAAAAYEAYLQVIDHVHTNIPPAEWEDLAPRYQEGWREACRTACELFGVEEVAT